MQNEFEYDPTHLTVNQVSSTATAKTSDNREHEALDTQGRVTISEILVSTSHCVLARDIQIDPAVHERRSFSDDDLDRAKAVVSQPHLLAPFPVLERGNEIILLDGFVTLQALLALNPIAEVKVYKVDDKDAVAVRLADTRQRGKREPMAPSRQALARSRSGVTQDAIAKELGLSPGSVSQMVSAAEVEEEHENLADLIIDRSKLSRGFWFDLYATRERLKKADEAEPDGQTPCMDRLATAVSDLVSAGEPVSAERVRKALGVNVRRDEPKRRNRVLGKPLKRPGLKVLISIDRKRQGGPVINFPPGFPIKDFDAALEALLAFLMGREPTADNAPQN